MMEQGLLQEIDGLMKKNYSKNLQSMKAIGYKEWFDYAIDNLFFPLILIPLNKATYLFISTKTPLQILNLSLYILFQYNHFFSTSR